MITTGTRLGPYEITAPIGAGGMGEVYRARDSRLDRTVAIKVLPRRFSSDERLRERFEREAKAISALSHPHICTLHDVGSHDGVEYLVMEHLEGESLADRLERGPIPVEQAIRVGIEIATALHAAHRVGIVHRDLKPGNVFLTKNGAKLLDFGLAKVAPAAISTPDTPTAALTQQRPLTEEGTVLGTFQYMAPEQVEGREADPRTDVFALGALLYEMVTGRRAFDGQSKASVIASILDREPPPISTLQPLTPRAFERVVRICLAKDPDQRWQSAHDVATALRWAAEGDAEEKPRAPRRWREAVAWALAAALLIATVVLLLPKKPASPPRAVRSQILPPADVSLRFEGAASGALSISPDGEWITFSAEKDTERVLWLRRVSELTARPVPFTEDAMFPFWSPDSRSLAFFAGGKLKRVALAGGPAVVICDAADGRSGSWSRDGVIVFEPEWRLPIHRVAAAGGRSVAITRLDPSKQETTHRWATFLPDGKHFLYLAGSHTAEDNSDLNSVYVTSIDGGERKLLLHARSNAAYAAGHLLFVRDRFLLAQPFDLEKLELRGEPRAIAEGVHYEHGYLRASFAVSDDGTLVYTPAQQETTSTLHWLDRATAKVGEAVAKAGRVGEMALSPDATKVVVGEGEPSDLYLIDLKRQTRVRITSHRLNEIEPVWSPDGKTIAFSSDRAVDDDPFTINPQHPGSERLLVRLPETVDNPSSWSPDGRLLLVDRSAVAGGGTDIHVLPIADPARIRPWVATRANEWRAQFSPDGRWVAFNSDESGRAEVYVAPFPGPGPRIQVSTEGGEWPTWRADGKEIYFGSRKALWSVEVRTSPSLEAGPPREIEAASIAQPWDKRALAGAMAPDGTRLLIALREGEPPATPIVMVQGWAATTLR